MNPIRFIGLLMVVMAGEIHGQSLAIYLDTDDCINCTSVIGQVNTLTPAIHTTIYCDRSKQRFMPELLGELGVRPNERVQVRYVKTDWLRKRTKGRSQCRFLTGKAHGRMFALKELADHVSEMDRLCREYKQVLTFPFKNSIVLSDRLAVNSQGDGLIIADQLMGRTFHLRVSATDSAICEEVRFDEHFKRTYLSSIGKDTLRYDSLAELMRGANMEKPHVIGINTRGDTLDLLVDVRYPDTNSVHGAMIQTYPAFVSMLHGTVVDVWNCNWLLPSDLDHYLMLVDEGFAIHGAQVTMPVFMYRPGDGMPALIARFNRSGNSITFEKTLDATYPKTLWTDGPNAHRPSSGFSKDLYWLRGYPFIVDLSNGHSMDLYSALSKAHAPLFAEHAPLDWFWDVQRNGTNSFMVLYSDDRATWVAWLDMEAHTLLRKQKVPTDGIVLETIQLLDDGRLMALSKNYDALIVLQ